jgi:hypothetical protein
MIPLSLSLSLSLPPVHSHHDTIHREALARASTMLF